MQQFGESFMKYHWLIFFILLASCSKKAVPIPPDIIQKKLMIEIMTDVQLAEAAKDVSMPDDKQKVTVEQSYAFIFNKYHITRDQFQKSFNYYKSNPQLMEEVLTEVLNRLSEMQAKQSGGSKQ
jgi:hypothetical protein